MSLDLVKVMLYAERISILNALESCLLLYFMKYLHLSYVYLICIALKLTGEASRGGPRVTWVELSHDLM